MLVRVDYGSFGVLALTATLVYSCLAGSLCAPKIVSGLFQLATLKSGLLLWHCGFISVFFSTSPVVISLVTKPILTIITF